MILNKLYRKCLDELQSIYSAGESAGITDIIFESFAGLSRSDVIKDPQKEIPPPIHKKIADALLQLLQHKPVQYITGEAWFCDCKLKVSEAVLIPRPETAELVMHTLSSIKDKPVSIIDIGTGSGCIPIAIKKKRPEVVITAIDKSREALGIAGKNAETHKTDICFQEMDFLDESCWASLGGFDIIISNPPYIRESHKEMLDKNVTKYEPHLALFVPDGDPIIFYRKIAGFAQLHLHPAGSIYLETHEDHANEVTAHFTACGFDATIEKDMFEKERFVIARHQPNRCQ